MKRGRPYPVVTVSRGSKYSHRTPVKDGPTEAMELDNYANVVLDFRDWCVVNKINFRVGMMAAMEKYKRSHR